ncbi:MAG: polysaccharide pyruvyl transferase family protein [Butyrivibrio sp.]|nr:polysaccharide pyruvyl transferase family protein [Butyrivibrio sp.]
MKYGRLVYNDLDSDITSYTNVGDWCQTFAVDRIYEKIGVPKEDIVDINRSEIGTYKGEKVLVIIQADCRQLEKKDFFPVSRDVVPVYLGVHRTQKKHILEGIDKNSEIIGCRDEASYEMFKELGYDAFISGCLTTTLPKRKEGNYSEVYLVDCPSEVEQYVPKEYEGHVHKFTHEIFNRANPEQDSRKYYEEYRDNARLVVTSRLHCAVPCMAMGIPVILVRKYFDDRYAWLEKFIKPYLPEEFSDINWNVSPVDLEEHKEKLFKIAKYMIEAKTDSSNYKNSEFVELKNNMHQFFSYRKRITYKAPFKARMYWLINAMNPKVARFIRLKLLKKFTVIGK